MFKPMPLNWLEDPNYTFHKEYKLRECLYFVRHKKYFIGYCNTQQHARIGDILVPDKIIHSIK
jgi:hypothetical protein